MAPVIVDLKLNVLVYALQFTLLMVVIYFKGFRIPGLLLIPPLIGLIAFSIDLLLYGKFNYLALRDCSFFLIIAYLISCKKDLDKYRLYHFIVVLGVLTALIACYQSVFNVIPPDLELKSWNRVGPFIRAGVGYTEENYLATYLVFTYVILLKSQFPGYLKIIARILLILGVLFTFSRSGIVSLFLVEIIVSKNKTPVIILILIFALVTLFIPEDYLSFLFSRFSSSSAEASSSTDSRIFQIFDGLGEILNPKSALFGVQPLFRTSNGQIIHNTFLYTLVDYGLILGIGYLTILFKMVFEKFNWIIIGLFMPFFFLNLLGFKVLYFYLLIINLEDEPKNTLSYHAVPISRR